MKLLFIYKYLANYNIDEHLHLDFVKVFVEEGHEVNVYGPNVEDYVPELCKIKWNNNVLLLDIKNVFDFEAIVCITKARMFMHYSPPTRGNIAEDCILPKDFKSFQVPKIMLEEDFHYELNDDWYYKTGFDIRLNRHLINAKRTGTIKSEWFPFSVDTKVFKDVGKQRINKICFAGSISPPYPDRIFACNLLTANKCIDVFSNRSKVGKAYVDCLQSYVSHLSGASSYDICCAKNFEIMSSGSLLLTNNFTGLTELFPTESYILWDEYSLLNFAKLILDKEFFNAMMKDKIALGIKTINEKHSHSIRIKQLMEIINGL